MPRFTAVAAVLLVAVLACAAIAQQPPGPVPGPAPGPAPGPGFGPGPQGPGQGMGPPPSLEQMFERLADRIGLTEADKKATRKALTAKMQATRAQMAEVRALGEVARKENATDAELRAALQKFEGALTAYHQKIRAIDAQLIKALSLKAQARLTAMGVIDNGVGQRLGQRRGPGMGMQGGQGPGFGPGPQPGMQQAPAGQRLRRGGAAPPPG